MWVYPRVQLSTFSQAKQTSQLYIAKLQGNHSDKLTVLMMHIIYAFQMRFY